VSWESIWHRLAGPVRPVDYRSALPFRLPRLSRLYAERKFGDFLRLLARLMGIGAAVGVVGTVGAALMGKPLLRLVYTDEYAAYSDVLIVVMVGVGLVASFTFLGTAVAAAQKFTVQAVIHVAKLAVIVAACYVLVVRMGPLGGVGGFDRLWRVFACLFHYLVAQRAAGQGCPK